MRQLGSLELPLAAARSPSADTLTRRRSRGAIARPRSSHLGALVPVDPPSERLTKLARLLFGIPELIVLLAEVPDERVFGDSGPDVLATQHEHGSNDSARSTARRKRGFCATTLLRSSDGRHLGTLTISTEATRAYQLADEDRQRLEALADIAAELLEVRRQRRAAECM